MLLSYTQSNKTRGSKTAAKDVAGTCYKTYCINTYIYSSKPKLTISDCRVTRQENIKGKPIQKLNNYVIIKKLQTLKSEQDNIRSEQDNIRSEQDNIRSKLDNIRSMQDNIRSEQDNIRSKLDNIGSWQGDIDKTLTDFNDNLVISQAKIFQKLNKFEKHQQFLNDGATNVTLGHIFSLTEEIGSMKEKMKGSSHIETHFKKVDRRLNNCTNFCNNSTTLSHQNLTDLDNSTKPYYPQRLSSFKFPRKYSILPKINQRGYEPTNLKTKLCIHSDQPNSSELQV